MQAQESSSLTNGHNDSLNTSRESRGEEQPAALNIIEESNGPGVSFPRPPSSASNTSPDLGHGATRPDLGQSLNDLQRRWQTTPFSAYNNSPDLGQIMFQAQVMVHIQSKIMAQAMAQAQEKEKTEQQQVRKQRIVYSYDQLEKLEARFQRQPYLDTDERRELARQLGISDEQVQIWFQNRRRKKKVAAARGLY